MPYEPNVIEYHKWLKGKMLSKTYQQVRVEFCKAFQQKHSDITEAMSSNDLASTVCRITCQDLLSRALKLRKTVAGKLLKCVRTVNSIELAAHDLGEKYHKASSEPFFYETTYSPVKRDSAVAAWQVHSNNTPNRCVLNGLELDEVPVGLSGLDALSKQLIQRAKA